MIIHGFQKVTLLDYPGKVACTIFTAGCDFRCPFCHNAGLVTRLNTAERIEEDEIFFYLNKRRGILDGVCVTGGEPTLQADLPAFLRHLRTLGYAIKLDTNGSRPDVLEALLREGLLDYVAMDIKNRPERYAETIGMPGFDVTPIRKSIALLFDSSVDFEFRTTVTDEFHTPQDIEALTAWISGAPHYYLQPFVDSGNIVGTNIHAPSTEKLNAMLAAAKRFLPCSAIRGA